MPLGWRNYGPVSLDSILIFRSERIHNEITNLAHIALLPYRDGSITITFDVIVINYNYFCNCNLIVIEYWNQKVIVIVIVIWPKIEK